MTVDQQEEEHITLAIRKYLEANGYKIIAIDFPQSGTGIPIHPDKRSSKTAGIIVPDIIAKKSDCCFIMENKPTYSKKDFTKLNRLRDGSEYLKELSKLATELQVSKFFYGIGLPDKKSFEVKALNSSYLVDFVITVDASSMCRLLCGKLI